MPPLGRNVVPPSSNSARGAMMPGTTLKNGMINPKQKAAIPSVTAAVRKSPRPMHRTTVDFRPIRHSHFVGSGYAASTRSSAE